ncbi:TonB-dependent receptor plug domain-containing protein, partial [Sinomicrobium weinanense]
MKLTNAWLLLLWLVCSVFTITAQNTHASIEGMVVDETSEPLMGVSVVVKNESTGFSTATVSDISGKYILKQLPLGKPYTITVSYMGYGTQTRKGYELNQGDELRIDFKMEESAEALDEVVVTASGLKSAVKNFGAATSVTSQDLEKLPVNGRNYTSLIDLSPLSTGNSLSGQLPSSTNFTVDGMTARNPTSGGTANRRGGSYAISMEAIREFKVSTNQYDVTYGRSGGGSINTVTKSGTNTLSGSIFTFGRTDWLSSPYDIRGNRRDEDFSSYQYGFSLGGPIVKDKVHFFVAWDHQEDTNPLQIADLQTAEDERRYNVSRESLDRYLDIARNKYGVADSPQFGSFNRKRGTDAIFARIDWQLNDKNLLTLRNNYVFDLHRRAISDNSSIELYEVYSDVRTTDNSFLASLRSELNPKMTNELKFQYLRTSESAFPGEQIPSQNIPRAIVERVHSEVNGKDVYTTIQLGGQRYIPESFYNNVFQLVDNLYYSTDKIDYTFGADLMYTHMESVYGSEMNGRFYFTGLDDFENLQPYRYVREVNLMEDPAVTQNIMAFGAYAQMQASLFPGFELMAGIRADYTNYLDKPNFNEIVYEDLGLRTDNSLSTFQLQPRIQATWDIGERGKDILRFGGGIFGSDINNYIMINNMVFDGTRVASVDINRNDVTIPT